MGLDAVPGERRRGAFAGAILILALIPAAAAMTGSLRRRENRVLPMGTGRKRP